MDATGLCEGCGQMLVAFLVLALRGGIQLESPGKYFMQTRVGPEAPHLNSGSSMSLNLGVLPARVEAGREWGGWVGAELEAQRDGVEDRLCNFRGTDFKAGTLGRMIGSEAAVPLPV